MACHPAVRLDIVSDVMCPWCYIGKRRLEAAMALVPEIEFNIRWRPFKLDPSIPQHGMDRQDYLNRKFDPEQAKDIYAKIAAAGAAQGLAFNFTAIAKSPNTLDAHRLIRWAAGAGCQGAVVERLFQLYFLEGRNIGDRLQLASVAKECGMDPEQVGKDFDSGKDSDLVRREITLAQTLGVTGVPAFIFGSTYLVSGAQSPETLADVAHKAAKATKSENRADVYDHPA